MKLTTNNIHTPVLLNETITSLCIKKDGSYIDCTAGFGGHSSEIVKNLKTGCLICIDQDINAINYLNNLFKSKKNVKIIQNNFSNIDQVVNQPVDGILMDLGVSSLMFDDPKRGFSYKFDGPLDMRMDVNGSTTAADIINKYTREKLITLFREYAEVANPSKVVNAIIRNRELKPITTTLQLANIIANCIPGSLKRKHPAKVYFQALRIEVNKELDVLVTGLEKACKLLKQNGRLCVITFHSLEDRIVKNTFKKLSQTKDLFGKEVPLSKISKPKFRLITKKPITPTASEMEANRRSHSAKLRVIEKI